ncbi:MAG: ABC transporter permease [Candidatus Levybacteria bacterium]|nr:ABC transporter permease [Candidatus Levybacteria bacterium]MBI3093052.1 ABC transporter permease [Candidatus Levybacteria bacterium]
MQRHLKTAWHHIRRYPYQTSAAVLIMTLTFFVISAFTFIILGSSKIISFFESKPQVTAFFREETKQENIDALKDQLNATGKVAAIRFVSKQEAIELYTQQNKDDPLLLEFVTADILPASLEISTVKIDDLSGISEMLKQSPFVENVIFQKDVVSTLTAWTSAIRKIGVALIAGLSLVSIFIMATIIGIKISHKKEEIEIMRLIGATSWYVRWPFLFEGVFYAVLGAFLGWFVASGVLLYATPFLSTFLQGVPLLPVPPLFLLGLLGVEFLFAIILSIFSSFLAVLRYLK